MRADRAGPPLVWAGSVAPVTVRVCKEPRTGADRTTDRSRSSIATCRSVDLAPAFVCTTKETIPRYKPPRSACHAIAKRRRVGAIKYQHGDRAPWLPLSCQRGFLRLEGVDDETDDRDADA